MSDRKIIYLDDAIDAAKDWYNGLICGSFRGLEKRLKSLPSAQPEQDILSWLLAYHAKSFDLHGRYMPHEVIGWLVHDFANAYMAERREE